MPSPRRQSMTPRTTSIPTIRSAPPTALGTTWPRKSDTDVTSPSTRWISSPGVWRRWNSWSSPSTWRVICRRRPLVVPHAVTVAKRVTVTAMTWVATAMARNSRASSTNCAVVPPSVAVSTIVRTTSGPARARAEPIARSTPRTAQRRASGRNRASRARPRDGGVVGTRPVSRGGARALPWVSPHTTAALRPPPGRTPGPHPGRTPAAQCGSGAIRRTGAAPCRPATSSLGAWPHVRI